MEMLKKYVSNNKCHIKENPKHVQKKYKFNTDLSPADIDEFTTGKSWQNMEDHMYA